jgi:adenine-specific DNA-methyltransferase
MAKKPASPKSVDAIRHTDAKRKNIPTAEHEAVLEQEAKRPRELRYPRNTDLDPQLVWRGKDEQDGSDLVVKAPPLYIQEKVHPKALIDDLLRQTKDARTRDQGVQTDLFADFNGVPEGADRTDFYQHDQNWTNRMILGDSLQVMASLAEREGLRGKVQCIYFDPPYGIKFNSNFQWSTTSRDVKDGKSDHITREPEQVKAFRDTWRDGVHSYLTYLRDRLTVARDLLADTGSIFAQIGEENVHLIRNILDEVFGPSNFVNQIAVLKTTGVMASTSGLNSGLDYVLWYRRSDQMKYRELFQERTAANAASFSKKMLPDGTVSPSSDAEGRRFRFADLLKAGPGARYDFVAEGRRFDAGRKWWGTTKESMERCVRANRVKPSGSFVYFVAYEDDFRVQRISSLWTDTTHLGERTYVVQTGPRMIERCILMASDPGDLVLDPTCGSGTTAYVAEQWGRRWITIDTSRVALALARARVMGARYSYYLLADSPDGKLKEADLVDSEPSTLPVHGNIRLGFVYERVPHITLKSIANNAEIDATWERWQKKLEPLREQLNAALKKRWEEWEIPREAEDRWPDAARRAHAAWWEARIGRQAEIDRSIASKAEFEKLYDRPYEDKKRVRVAGPFTVESLTPHRIVGADEHGMPLDPLAVGEGDREYPEPASFAQVVMENLRAAGVQQAHKDDRITFTSLTGWPGQAIAAEGRYMEGDTQRRAGILIGPEFGTVSRTDLVEAAREAGDAGFDVLISCAFNYDAHASEFNKLGRVPVLKARMNADLHMGQDLKSTDKANLFVVFGEPDIEVIPDGNDQLRIKVGGIDVFDPSTGEIRSDDPDTIACWFIDTDYNGESFFVRHAYFLGANDPYKSLKTTLKAEIDRDAWESLHSDTSRSFPKPASGRIAVKVINHLGDEVMRVLRV